MIMSVLINSLLQLGDTARALTVCRKWQQEMPHENVPYTEEALSMARCFYQANQTEQGDAIVNDLLSRADQWLSWIETISGSRRAGSARSEYIWMKTMLHALTVTRQYEREGIYQKYSKQYEHYISHE